MTAHYGFITSWLVAGPFDNTKGAGFHSVFPPDARVDTGAVYTRCTRTAETAATSEDEGDY